MNQTFAEPPHRLLVDVSLLLMRVIVGIVFAVHGAQKLFGLWGGPGWENLVDMLGIGPLAYLVAIGEFLGGLGIIVGFLARFSAAANIVIMIGAIVQVHGGNGFLLSNGGFEYNLALIGLLAPIVLLGPGAFAVGRFLPLPKSARTGRPILPLE
jgi:putative oxidoreductase